MDKNTALKKMNKAIRQFKAMPSAINFRLLEQAMLDYQALIK